MSNDTKLQRHLHEDCLITIHYQCLMAEMNTKICVYNCWAYQKAERLEETKNIDFTIYSNSCACKFVNFEKKIPPAQS